MNIRSYTDIQEKILSDCPESFKGYEDVYIIGQLMGKIEWMLRSESDWSKKDIQELFKDFIVL